MLHHGSDYGGLTVIETVRRNALEDLPIFHKVGPFALPFEPCARLSSSRVLLRVKKEPLLEGNTIVDQVMPQASNLVIRSILKRASATGGSVK